MKAIVTVSVAAMLLLAAATVHADRADRLRLIVPSTLPSDGFSVLRVEPTTPADVVLLDQVELQPDAGSVARSRRQGDALLVDFAPPFVAIDRPVRITVLVRDRAMLTATVHVTAVPPLTKLQSSSGPLGLGGPSMVILGALATATITSTSKLELAVNVGHIEPAVRGKDGIWRAIYTPPAQRFPQVAIVAAHDAAGHIDWLRIPLFGVGQAETHTRPSSQITLTIAGLTFGPFRTDARGAATNPVIAPPGIHRGVTRTMDSQGGLKDTDFDLGTPPFSRLTAVCNGPTVRLFQIGIDGSPLDRAPVLSGGLLSAPTRVGPGQWVATWKPAPNDVSTDVEVRIGDDKPVAACTLRAPAEPPSSLKITVDKPVYVAGSGPFEVHAQLGYRGPRPPLSVPIEVTSELGTVAMTTTATGSQFMVHPDDHFGGRTSFRVHARARGLESTVEIALVSGPRAKVVLHGPAKRLESSGAASARIAVDAEDAYGNPTSTRGLVATADGQSADVANGGFVYVAPRTTRWGDDVSVRDPVSGIAGKLTVALERPPSRFLVAVRAGYLTNFGKLSAPIGLLDIGYRLPWLHRRLSIGVEGGFYQGTRTNGVSMTFVGIPVLARLGYSIPLGRAALYAGAGGGVMVSRVATTGPALDQTQTQILGLFGAHLGLDVDVRFGRILVEAGYFYAPSSGQVSGNFGGLTATGGYRVNL